MGGRALGRGGGGAGGGGVPFGTGSCLPSSRALPCPPRCSSLGRPRCAGPLMVSALDMDPVTVLPIVLVLGMVTDTEGQAWAAAVTEVAAGAQASGDGCGNGRASSTTSVGSRGDHESGYKYVVQFLIKPDTHAAEVPREGHGTGRGAWSRIFPQGLECRLSGYPPPRSCPMRLRPGGWGVRSQDRLQAEGRGGWLDCSTWELQASPAEAGRGRGKAGGCVSAPRNGATVSLGEPSAQAVLVVQEVNDL